MSDINDLISKIRNSQKNVRFSDICKICGHFFGEPRQSGTSHRVYKTPWPGDPRVNVQNEKGKAKTYQVKQVIKAIDKLKEQNEG